MKGRRVTIGLALLVGLFVWLVDSLLDHLVFYEDVGFLDILILDVPGHELYHRLVALLSFVVFGIVISRLQQRRQQAESTAVDLFEDSPTPLWLEDASQVAHILDGLRDRGVTDLETYFEDDPDALRAAIASIRVLDVNRAALDLYDADSIGQLVEKLDRTVAQETPSVFLDQMLTIWEGAGRFEGEMTIRTIPGDTRRILLQWNALPAAREPYSRIVVSMTDITERKRAEDDLRRLNEDLEGLVEERTAELVSANEIKSKFLARMSHELRTPLNSILGFTGLILDGLTGEITDEQHRQLEMVQTSGRHLLDLVNDILDLSKIEAGEMGLAISRFSCVEVEDIVADLLRPLAEEKGVDLVVHVCPTEPSLLYTDHRAVQQILTNLVNNAIKYTDEGSVQIQCETTGDKISFAVTDTGHGIPAEVMESIFDEFRQVRPGAVSSPQGTGTGLGLAISRRLARMLGGDIEVESTVAVGSTFTLTIPIHLPGK